MKHTIAVVLVGIELIFALAFLGGAVFLYCKAPQMASIADLTRLQNLCRRYADAIDTQRDNLDRLGGCVVPQYASNLQKLSGLMEEMQSMATAMRLVADITKIGPIAKIHPRSTEKLDATARKMEALFPELSKTLGQSAGFLKEYKEEDHEKIIESLDSTMIFLRCTADTLEEQNREIPSYMRKAALVLCGVAAMVLLFAVTQALCLSCARSAQPRDSSPK